MAGNNPPTSTANSSSPATPSSSTSVPSSTPPVIPAGTNNSGPILPPIPDPPEAQPGAHIDGKLGSPTLDIEVIPSNIIQTAKVIDDQLIDLNHKLGGVAVQVNMVKPPAQDKISQLVAQAWKLRIDTPSFDSGGTSYLEVINRLVMNLHQMLETLHSAAVTYKKSDAEKADVFKSLGGH